MKITLELYDQRCSIECPHDDFDSEKLKDLFSRLLVAAEFPPSVVEGEGGEYQFVCDDEVIIKQSYLDKLERSKNEDN